MPFGRPPTSQNRTDYQQAGAWAVQLGQPGTACAVEFGDKAAHTDASSDSEFARSAGALHRQRRGCKHGADAATWSERCLQGPGGENRSDRVQRLGEERVGRLRSPNGPPTSLRPAQQIGRMFKTLVLSGMRPPPGGWGGSSKRGRSAGVSCH